MSPGGRRGRPVAPAAAGRRVCALGGPRTAPNAPVGVAKAPDLIGSHSEASIAAQSVPRTGIAYDYRQL